LYINWHWFSSRQVYHHHHLPHPSPHCPPLHSRGLIGLSGHGGIGAWGGADRALGGSYFPLMTRQKLNYLNSIRTKPHPLNYLYISGGVSSPHPPKTIFLRRDILFVRYLLFTDGRNRCSDGAVSVQRVCSECAVSVQCVVTFVVGVNVCCNHASCAATAIISIASLFPPCALLTLNQDRKFY